jgi:hypothetical protein
VSTANIKLFCELWQPAVKTLRDSMQFRKKQLLQNPLCMNGTQVKKGQESLEEELNSRPTAQSNDENVSKVQ